MFQITTNLMKIFVLVPLILAALTTTLKAESEYGWVSRDSDNVVFDYKLTGPFRDFQIVIDFDQSGIHHRRQVKNLEFRMNVRVIPLDVAIIQDLYLISFPDLSVQYKESSPAEIHSLLVAFEYGYPVRASDEVALDSVLVEGTSVGSSAKRVVIFEILYDGQISVKR